MQYYTHYAGVHSIVTANCFMYKYSATTDLVFLATYDINSNCGLVDCSEL